LAQQDKVSVYPNPARDVVQLKGDFKSDGLVEIFGPDGALVMQFRLKAGNDAQKANISQLKPGIYSYRITSGNKVLNGKFVKM
jgi:hypothetical protein